jgi:hypothetical protein
MNASFITSAPLRPRTYTSKPQRVPDRIQMHGSRIQPLHEEPGMGGYWGLGVFLIGGCLVGASIYWAIPSGRAVQSLGTAMSPHSAAVAVPSLSQGERR